MDRLSKTCGYFLACNSHPWAFHKHWIHWRTNVSWNWPALAMEHYIPVRWLHPCPLQQCQHLLQGRPIDSASETDRKRLMTALASGRQERNWRVSGAQRGGGGRVSFSLRICGCRGRQYVWCVLVTAQQLHHMSAWEGKGGSLLSFSSSSFEKQPYPVAWCCCHGVGLFWKGEREQKLGLAVNIIGKDAIISHLCLWPLFSCLLATKNSFLQTLWQHLMLELGYSKWADLCVSTMANRRIK